MNSNRCPVLGLLIGLLALPAAGNLHAADGDVTVDVIAELTDAGKKIQRPTPAHPAYYIPITAGYNAGGQPSFWQRNPPTDNQVIAMLARELAGQNYLSATHGHPPSLVMVVSWGYKAPRPATPSAFMMYIGKRPARPRTIPLYAIGNAADMLQLTGGNRAGSISWGADAPKLKDAVEAAGVPRYYITVVAADFTEWKHHAYVPLWTARISVPYWGFYFDEALPALLTTGGPMFGRDMAAPQMIATSVVPEGHVEVGTPALKADQTPVFPATKDP